MSTVISSHPSVTRAGDGLTSRGRALWPLAGALAGAAALAATFIGMPSLTEDQYNLGVGVVDELERGPYHAGFLLGLVSCAALLVVAAGWRRWAARQAPDSLTAGLVATGLSATAAINVIGVSLMGSMALYLPGGMDEGWLSREGLFANFNYLDFGILFGWWTTLVAAGAVAVMSLGRESLLPRWMGIVSILLALPAVAFATLAALPGFPGVTMPVWLIVISVGMMLSRTARA